MGAGQTGFDPAGNLEFQSVEQRIAQTKRLAGKMRLFLVGYSLVGAAVAVGVGYITVQQTAAWRNALPDGQVPNFQQLLSGPESPLLTAVVGGIAGLGLAVAGTIACLLMLGRINWPALKIFALLIGLPTLLSSAAVAHAATTQGLHIAALFVPIAVGFSLALLPFQLALLSFGVLRLALRQLRSSEKPIAPEDLPSAAAEYFGGQEIAALEAGLTPIKDSSYLPEWNKFRRYWMAPNGAYFACATWVDAGATTITGMDIYSATSDGHYFETACITPDHPQPSALEDHGFSHVEAMPSASLDELIDRHATRVSEWVCAQRCQPLEFTAEDASALAAYGIAALMRESRNDFLWLGNPYAGRALPPLPGRPRELEAAGANS